MAEGDTGFNNGYAFTITPATPDETSITDSFNSMMADPSGTSSGGLFGLNAKQWAGGLKDIGAGLSSAGKTATDSAGRPQQLGNPSQAQGAHGQAGGLGQLLALLAARANMFNQAAHQGAVPTPTRPGGGLLGL
jgi:hypothetical protein